MGVLNINLVTSIFAIIISLISLFIVIGIVLATRFQRKQSKKYDRVTDIVNEHKDSLFEVKDGLTKEDIKEIDNKVNIDKLMKELYDKYLEFLDKTKKLDMDYDGILCGFMKDFHINKIEQFKQNNYMDVIENVELVGYSITEYNKEELKFKVSINCLDYKKNNGNIVSGNSTDKLNEIIIITYKKEGKDWLISNIEKVYQKQVF